MPSAHRPGKRHDLTEFGTVSGPTRQIRVDRLEDRLRPLVPFPHRHSFYHLILVETGSGWHEIDFVRHAVAPRQVHLMRPGQVHSWSLDPRCQGYILEFGADVLDRRHPDQARIERHLGNVRTFLASTDRIQGILELMHEDYRAQGADFELTLRLHLSALIIELSRRSGAPREAASAERGFTDRFLGLVEEHFMRHHDVGFYARRLGVTPKALTMRSIRALGRSARDVLHERSLLEAKRLLAYSDLPIAGVGYELGFEDPNYFSRFFRAGAGLSPGAFRESVRTGEDEPRGDRS